MTIPRLFFLLILALHPHLSESATRPKATPVRDAMRGIHMRYNRVEGLFGGYQIKISPAAWNGISAWAETGYGAQNQAIRWAVGLTQTRPRYALSMSVFDRTETADADLIRTGENTFFALLYKGDYRDYFRSKNGFEFLGKYRLHPELTLQADLTAYAFDSMPVATQWSIFYPDRSFRSNPAVVHGNLGRLRLGAMYNTRRNPLRFQNAWALSAFYERGFREFPHNGLIISATRYQKTIWGNQVFIAHGRLATRTHTAEQFLFDLGGVGTLRGYGIKEFSGNRMLMANFDYLFRGDLFKHIPVRGAHLLNLSLFADAGWTHTAPRDQHLLNGFQDFSLRDIKTNIGLGIGFTERLFRFNIARRLDRNADPWAFSARLFLELK